MSGEPDYWDDEVLPPSPEGARIRAERERERARVEKQDRRIAGLRTRAMVRHWQMHITGPGPEVTFARWGRAQMVVGLAEAEDFVRRVESEEA